MAEGILKARLPGDKTVCSAGVGAASGEPATPEAIAVMSGHGFDITAHRARQLTREIADASDLILVADQSHIEWIARRHPHLRGRVHKLLKWENNRDLEDPFRMPQSYFEQTFAEAEMGISDWIKRL